MFARQSSTMDTVPRESREKPPLLRSTSLQFAEWRKRAAGGMLRALRGPGGGASRLSTGISTQMSAEEEDRKSLKRQKKEYRDEKKRVTTQLVSALRDPTVVVMADWLKIRGTLRKWSRYYCVLKPGLMILYKTNKTNKHGHWVGTILLNTCELIERPSKKDGFCFKLYQPLDQSIWATRGPLGESPPMFSIQHLPAAYLICRAASDQAGRCWMDALELSLRCTGLLMRTMHKLDDKPSEEVDGVSSEQKEARNNESEGEGEGGERDEKAAYSDTEAEKHFDGLDDQEPEPDNDDADVSEGEGKEESKWVESEKEVFPMNGANSQVEEVADENKSLVWSLLKQIRPGMDLSKVVLPTFILEPRSFLEKLADYYYHADLLAEAAAENDPFQRIVKVVKFYLSGFYKKPKGLKKPYNPILGETFRCSWKHPDGSTTYYIAEQVSHHPPVSSLFITNRKAGFNISGTILAKSKFYGNSLSAIMVGDLNVTLLNRGETYRVSLPYANCKGIMIGTMTMELAGPVKIVCDKTGYSCDLDFHLKPLLGGSMNKIGGQFKYGREQLATLEGHWDRRITIKEKRSGETELWNPGEEAINSRLPRYEIDYDAQDKWESKKLWSKVTAAIVAEDQYAATEEKTVLEQDQRARAKSNVPHQTKHFKKKGDVYEYIHAEYRPWDAGNDLEQIENDYVVSTRCRVKQKTQRKQQKSVSQSEGGSEESSDNDEEPRKKKNEQVNLDADQLNNAVKALSEQVEASSRRLEGSIDKAIQDALPSIQMILLIGGIFLAVQAILISFILNRSIK